MSDHGGNIYAASRATGIPEEEILDFSASINPMGVPRKAADALKAAIDRLCHYPEPYSESLSEHLGHHFGVGAESDHLWKWKRRAHLPSPEGPEAGMCPYPRADVQRIREGLQDCRYIEEARLQAEAGE